MTSLQTVLARRRIVLVWWAFESTWALALGFVFARALGRGVAGHPDGLEALVGGEGRGMTDFARESGALFGVPMLAVGVSFAVYGALSIVLAGSLAAAFAPPAPTSARAAVHAAFARWKTQLAIAALTLPGYFVAVLAWWGARDAHVRRANAAADPRIATLWIVLSLTTPAAIVAATSFLNDLARAHAMATGDGAWDSCRAALLRAWRRPFRWAGRYALYLAASGALVASWWWLAPPRMRALSGAGAAILYVGHLAIMLARVGTRSVWIAVACRAYREGTLSDDAPRRAVVVRAE